MIDNDQKLKTALAELAISEQRELAAQFVESIHSLNKDPLIKRALTIAHNKMHTENELNEIYPLINSLSVKTYTSCGNDADWLAQAAHFVATATKACVTPSEHSGDNKNLAWKCAMQARMAKNCAMMESEEDIIDNEAQQQYKIMDAYLNPQS